MKTIAEVSPAYITTIDVDDYLFDIIVRIYDGYYTLHHKQCSLDTAISYLPQEVQDTIHRKVQPRDEPLSGRYHFWDTVTL